MSTECEVNIKKIEDQSKKRRCLRASLCVALARVGANVVVVTPFALVTEHMKLSNPSAPMRYIINYICLTFKELQRGTCISKVIN